MTRIILLSILILAAVLRFYGLNWDQGHYLHPDERLYVNASNISLPANLDEFFSTNSPLNPKMFYYGSLPLFIYKSISSILGNTDFLLISRIVSAIVSTLTVPFIFLIGKQIFLTKVGLLAAFIFALAPGSIQHAHFNTTESMLTFLVSIITWLSIKVYQEKKYLLLIPLGMLSGMAYATKITGLTFTLIPFLSFLPLVLQKKTMQIILGLAVLGLTIIITGALLAPYQIIDFTQFQTEQEYMQGVTYGKFKPVFVIIYEGTIPYLYQIIKILPFTFGFISFPLSLIGLFLLGHSFKNQKNHRLLLLLITVFPLIYFLWSGSWFTKFSRYYLLLFPFLAIWTAFVLQKLNKWIILLFLCLIGLNGLLFLRIYLNPHTRITASEWIYQQILPGSLIAHEHWDDSLPLHLSPIKNPQIYTILELAVYEPDTEDKLNQLSQNLARADYFIISSRRVYSSILQNSDLFPLTESFYELLFAEKLGYQKIAQFTSYPFFFSDDFADETFQSYDHPPVTIFKNTQRLPAPQLRDIISQT